MCSNITGPPTCEDLIDDFLHAVVEQLHLWEWLVKEKGWSKESLVIYWPVWEQRLMCGLLVSSKVPVSHPVQARAKEIKILLLERIQNVLSLRWTDNSGLINKASLLNKTGKDTRLSTCCVPSQFKLTTERPHKQTNNHWALAQTAFCHSSAYFIDKTPTNMFTSCTRMCISVYNNGQVLCITF